MEMEYDECSVKRKIGFKIEIIELNKFFIKIKRTQITEE